MGVILLMVVLVVGFLYTNNHPPSRYRQKRSTGWNAYFHVAAWGLLFCILGGLAALGILIFLDLLSIFLSIPSHLPWFDYTVPWLGRDLFSLHIPGGFGVGTVVSLMLSASMSFGMAIQHQNRMKANYEEQMKEYKKVAEADGLEALLFDSMQQNLLVLISLKSRKTYVGKVHQARFIHADLENIVIIPMLSGYRDKDTLTFKQEHSYTDYYKEHVISDKSQPLSIYDFRTVISRSEIDTASLFDPDTFKRFSQLDAKESSSSVRFS